MSKGSKKTTSTSNSTQSTSAPSYLTTDTENALAAATALYNQGAPAPYSGQTYASFDPLQTEAMNDTVNLARQGSPLVASAQSSLQDMLDTPSGSEPVLQQYLASLTNQTGNNINASFNANGRFGSGANAATAGTAITNATLPVLTAQINADNQTKLAAANEAPTLANYDFNNIARIGAVGDENQAMTQEGINQSVSNYDYNAQAPENWLNQYLGQINNSNANKWTTTNGSSTNTQTQSNGSGFGSVLGTGLGLASMFVPGGQLAGLSSLAAFGGSGLSGVGQLLGSFGSSSPTGPYQPSDKQLKENIHYVGDENGHKTYEFNYIGLPGRRFRGVMAQEVAQKNPEAVIHTGKNLAVNYDLIGVKFTEI